MDSDEIDWSQPDTGKTRGRRLRSVDANERASGPEWLRGHSGTYDPDKFYVRSTDERGHQYKVKNINVPMGYSEALGRILEYFPEYRSYGDIARDALVHMMVHRGQQIDDGFVTEFMETELSQRRADYSIMRMERRNGEVESYKTALETSLGQKDWEELDKMLEGLRERLEGWWSKYPVEEVRPYDPYMERMEELWSKYAAEMKRIRERGEWK